MNKIIYYIVFPLLLVFGLIVEGKTQESSVKKFSLKEAQDYAVQNHQQTKNARIEQEIAEKEINETTATGFPQINGSIDFQHFLEQPTSLIPAEFMGGRPGEYAEVKFGTEYDVKAQVTAQQLIFDGSYFVGVKASKVYAQLKLKQQQQTAVERREAVTKSYYNVLARTRQISILDSSLQNLRSTYQETRARYENGFVDKIEVDRLKLSVASLKQNLRKAERQQHVAALQLKAQLGMSMEDSLILTQALTDFLPESKTAALPGEPPSYANNLQQAILDQQKQLRELDVQKNTMAYLPNLSAFFTHRQNAQRDNFDKVTEEDSWYPATLWGVKLQVPLFTSFQRTYRRQQAKLELVKVKNREKQLSKQLKVQWQQVKSAYLSAYENFKTQQDNLKLARDIYQQAVTRYEEGMYGNTELVQTENDYLDTQRQYISALSNLLITKAELQRVLEQYDTP